MNKLYTTLVSIFLLISNSYGATLPASSIEVNNITTSSASYVDVAGASVTVDITGANKVMLVATYNTKMTAGSADVGYRIVDSADPDVVNSGEMLRTNSAYWGMGSVVHVFNVSGASKTYKLQHKTASGEVNTSVQLTAIVLYDGSNQLTADMQTLGGAVNLTNSWASLLETGAIAATGNGGYYVTATIVSSKIVAGTTAYVGQWQLQYKVGVGGTWTDLGHSVNRSTTVQNSKGNIKLVAALPDNTTNASNYYFRIIQRQVSSSNQLETSTCKLVVVSMATPTGFYPIAMVSKPTATTSSTSPAAITNNIFSLASASSIFLHAQCQVRASAVADAPLYDLLVTEGATERFNSSDFARYIANNTERGSMAVSGLVTGLNADTDYAVSFRHTGVASKTITTENSYLVGFGLTMANSFKPLVVVTATEGLASSSYNTLKAAFDDINAGVFRGAITIMVNKSTTETATCTLNRSGDGSASFTSVVMYPTAAGVKIAGSIAGPLIELYGAANVTIDGRVNMAGSDVGLEIDNTNTVSTNATAIQFNRSSSYNLLRYCLIKGASSNYGKGVVTFTTGSGGAATGNDYNVVEYNNITSTAGRRTYVGVFSAGAAGRENSFNTIRNNNIYNFMNQNVDSYGINIATLSDNWTLTGNSLYETTDFVPAYSTANKNYFPINIGVASTHSVTGNYIGGKEPLCGGGAWTMNATTKYYFSAIYANGATSGALTIDGNVIKNFAVTNASSNPWDAITVMTGNADITNNTIGASTGTGSITVTVPAAAATTTISGGAVTAINIKGGGSGYTTAPTIIFTGTATTPATATATLTGGVVTGYTITNAGAGYATAPTVTFDGSNYSTTHLIRVPSTGIINITGNTIGSVTTLSSAYYSHGLEVMYLSGTGSTLTVSNNAIGSTVTANSLYVTGPANLSNFKLDLWGIYCANAGTRIITGNTIANLGSGYTGTDSSTRLIGIFSNGGSNTIQNNIVRNLSTPSGQAGTGSSASITGIASVATAAGTTQNIIANTVYNLSNTNATSRSDVYGIYFSASSSSAHTVSRNFIHSLSFASSNTGCDMDGIVLIGGNTTCANNIINLGEGITTGYKINGIWDEGSAGSTAKVYFNSIHIGGTVSGGVTSYTGALWNRYNAATRNYRNNIFSNVRTGGTTGKHYAIRMEGMVNVTIDYNNYYSASGSLGRISSTDRNTLVNWKTGTSQDLNSLSIDPAFPTPGGTDVENYRTLATLPAVFGSGVTSDYLGLVRSVTPMMGAIESKTIYYWRGDVSTDYGTADNWEDGDIPPAGANIGFVANPDRECILDADRVVGSITNAQSTDKLVLNGHQLTVTGNFVFSNDAKIDATATSSRLNFTGLVAQNIPLGALVSNTTDAITLNNAEGLTLGGALTVVENLTLTSGALIISANTLTINGTITQTSGTLTGGATSNLTIGGSGASVSLSAVSLNNLTLNRSNGITLSGNVSVGGTLALTAGTITVGANTLTISGNAPTRVAGNIDASHASATMAFANASAITLPAALFTGDIQNLTFSAAGGLTAGANLAITGIINLNAANPSATKGLLDMASFELEMKGASTTTGAGDVTGRIIRNNMSPETTYTFGSSYTSMRFYDGTAPEMPTQIKFIVKIGATHATKASTIQRYYEIVRTGGSTPTKFTLNLRYLDSELNGISENDLVFWDHHIPYSGISPHEHGKTDLNTTENWLSLSGHGISYLVANEYAGEVAYVDDTTTPQNQTKIWMLSAKETTSNFTWLGSASEEWDLAVNWSGGAVPTSTSDVVIPSSTPYTATLLNDETRDIKSINIEVGATLEGGSNTTLNVHGALVINNGTPSWRNMGTFNAGTSKVIFKATNAAITGTTDFYKLDLSEATSSLLLLSGSTTRVANTFTLHEDAFFDANYNGSNTFVYNGADQSVASSLNSTYYNLELSGSGTKTMPSTAVTVLGDFSTNGTATATAASAMAVGGNFVINDGSAFGTGDYNHTVAGNFQNDGTFTPDAGNSITFNGTVAQNVFGDTPTTFEGLTINNNEGVTLLTDFNISGALTLTAGELHIESTTLGINGTVSKTGGFLGVDAASSLGFAGSSAVTLPNDLFSSTPTINNLTLNNTNGLTLGNQSLTINGTLAIPLGTLTVGANTLTLAGNSPTRTTGTIDASDASATLAFTNVDAITLPASIFSANVNDFIINGAGGITASSNFAINGVLSLQSANPSDSKGSLDMLDGATIKTLTMGANATTIGVGDVTGIVARTTIAPEVNYTFGNQYTRVYFPDQGTLPTAISAKITIGAAPSWKAGGIKREVEIIQTGADATHASPTKAVMTSHYLDTELNGNTEESLVFWIQTGPTEYGRSSYNAVDNWISISNVDIAFYPTSFGTGTFSSTLADMSLIETITWTGANSTSWTTITNWSPQVGPSSNKNIIIPDASSTDFDPTIPAFTEIKTMTLQGGAILNAEAAAELTVNGGNSAWLNSGGTFNPNTSMVIFSGDATINGTTSFYDLTINATKSLTLESDATVKIAGTVTNNGAWYVNNGYPTTVEYNGGVQSIINPNGITGGYYNLILSGGSAKTLPALTIENDLTLSDNTTNATAGGALTIKGNVAIGAGATLTASDFSHAFSGNLVNNGTLSSTSAGTATFDGTLPQSISGAGTTGFYSLAIANSSGVSINNNVSVAGGVSIASGKLLTINPASMLNVAGSITNSAGYAGLLVKCDPSQTLANGTLIFHNSQASGQEVSATVEMYSKASRPAADYKWQFFGIPLRSMVANSSFYGSFVRRMYESDIPAHWSQLNTYSTLTSFTGYEITQVTPKIITFQGILENKDFDSGELSYHSDKSYPGEHLIGNPYTAAIDISKIGFTGSIDNSVQLYNTGSYDDWDGAGDGSAQTSESILAGQYIVVPKNNAGAGGLPQQIPSMQAFIVKATAAGASVEIPYSAAGTVVKNTTVMRAPKALQPGTRIDVKGTSFGDRMWLFTQPETTRGFDNGWDGAKIFGVSAAPQLFAMEASGNYQVNTVPDVNNTELGFQAGDDNTYTMTFTHENLDIKYPILYLKDLQNNVITDITSSGTQYSFTANNTSNAEKRFKIITSIDQTTENSKQILTKLSVFCNKNTIFVENLTNNSGELSIFDISGKIVQKGKFNPQGTTALKLNLIAGSYVVKAKCLQQFISKVIVVE